MKLFHPYQQNILSSNDQDLEIGIWCLDEHGDNYHFRVNGYQYSFYLSNPAQDFERVISESKNFGKRESVDFDLKVEKRKNIYDYSAKDSYFVKYIFPSYRDMAEMKKYLTAKFKYFKIIEHDIDVIRKMYTDLNFSYADWFYVNNLEKYKLLKSESLSICEEYSIQWSDMIKDENCMMLSKPVTMSYDIECLSNDENKFPDKFLISDAIFMIGITFERLGVSESIKYYCIYIGEKFEDELTMNGKEVICINVENEKDLLINFFRTIKEENPTILTGYNIGLFDNQYIYTRSQINNVDPGNLSMLLTTETPYMKSPFAKSFWESKDLFTMDGRISIDVFDYMLRVHGGLSKHSLNYVSGYFLNESKVDMLPKDMFRIYKKYRILQLMNNDHLRNKLDPFEKDWLDQNYINSIECVPGYDMKKVAEYCVQDTILPIKLMKKLDIWANLKELSSLMGVQIERLLVDGEQVRCFSQIYNDLHKNGNVLILPKFNNMNSEGGFVSEPNSGLHKNVIIQDFMSLYPSIIITYNISYETLVKDNTVPDSDCIIITFTQKECQIDPNTGKKPNKGTIRYKELLEDVHYELKFIKHEIYEGILPRMMKHLLGERSKCKKRIEMLKKEYEKLEMYPIGHPKHNEKINKIGINNALERTILEAKQLALKLSANSTYGFLKVRKGGKMPFPDGARAITAMGRLNIIKCNDLMVNNTTLLMSQLKDEDIHPDLKKYDLNTPCEVVYNDTDSCFVKAPHIGPIHLSKYGKMLQKAFSYHLSGSLVLEYEKTLAIVILVTKKRYTGIVMNDSTGEYMIDKNTGEYVMYTRGLVTAKRDGCSFMRNLFGEISLEILKCSNMVTVLSIIFKNVTMLLSGKVSLNDLFLMKKIGEEYSNENAEMNLFQKNLNARGREIDSGSKIEYAYCVSEKDLVKLRGDKHMRDSADKMGDKYWLDEECKSGTAPDIDYILYLDKISPPIDQIFSLAYDGEKLRKITIKKNRAKTAKNLTTPLGFISIYVYNMEESIYRQNPKISYKDLCGLIVKNLDTFLDNILDNLLL